MIYTSPVNWSNAPEWANWFAVDGDDGLAYWYEECPSLVDENVWYARNSGLAEIAGHVSPPVLILEARPENRNQDRFDKFINDLSDLIAAYQD